MNPLPHYNFDDFIHLIRPTGQKSKQYKHWCKCCQKDRGYAFKNKILREDLCHACKMQTQEVTTKISINSKKLKHSKESKLKISQSLYANYGSNPINRHISRNLRSRLNKAIKHEWKTGSAISDLGCSIDELRIHLESRFQPGMTWDNYGRTGWHIDHIKPLCKFNLQDEVQFKEACNYINLQPMWVKDNLEKRKTDGTF